MHSDNFRERLRGYRGWWGKMKSRPARSVMALPTKSGNFEVLTVERLSFAEKGGSRQD